MNLRLKLFLMIGMFASLTAVHAASFDCSKASSPTEKMICQNPKISKLDDRLSEVYKEVRKADASVVEEQKSWLKDARACKDEKCLENAYGIRVEELENRLAKLSQVKPQASPQPTAQVAGKDSDIAWCTAFLSVYGRATNDMQTMEQNYKNLYSKLGVRAENVIKRWNSCMGNDKSEAKNLACRQSLGSTDQVYWEESLIAYSKAKEAYSEGGIKRLKANVQLKCDRFL